MSTYKRTEALTVFRVIKKTIRKSLDFFGYRLVSHRNFSPVDVRKLGNNPKALGYYCFGMSQILMDVDFKRGRGLDGYSLGDNSAHPFMMAIASALGSEDYKKTIRQSLSNHYEAVQPSSAAEWMGFEFGEVTALDQEPPWLVLYPWENCSLDARRQMMMDCASQDNKEHGLRASIDEGWRDFGPVSEKILDLEANRLYSLMVSIKNFGVVRHDGFGGDVGATVLVDDEDDFRWLVGHGGQHRAPAIAAMGHKNITIRVWQVVERKDVAIWPNVQSGLFTEASALKVFDRVFNSRLSCV